MLMTLGCRLAGWCGFVDNNSFADKGRFTDKCRLGWALSLASAALTAMPAWSDTLTWSDLRPELAPIDDPFVALTDEQLYELGIIAKLQALDVLTDAQRHELRDIALKLAGEGVNVEKLFAMRDAVTKYRRQMATQPNLELVDQVAGKDYQIPGFITPIEFHGTQVTQFFLVPTAGACVHTPPPPANQIVLVDYPQGIEFSSLNVPVWVKGQLKIESTKADVTYVDGARDIEAVYRMRAVSIEEYH